MKEESLEKELKRGSEGQEREKIRGSGDRQRGVKGKNGEIGRGWLVGAKELGGGEKGTYILHHSTIHSYSPPSPPISFSISTLDNRR